MQNYIIILILLVIVAIGVKESIKHFRGEGGCCGGESSKPRKKKLKHKIVTVYTFHVEGMKCQNCANSVTRAVNDITGASAAVSLKKKMAKVSCDREIDAQTIIDAISKRGYAASLIK